MEATSVIPYTAWEQAVFVALFIVMIVALLAWFGKQQKSWQEFMNHQNSKWQKTVDEQNNQWQHWLEEQNQRECASMDRVTAALEKLSTKIDAHDDKVDSRISDAVALVSKRPTRSTKTTKKE